jgi:hypothetical protein
MALLARFRKPRQAPQPKTIDPATVAAGLRAFADDLTAGDTFALEALTDHGELPFTADEWAAYPTCYIRRVRIAYLGKTGPGDVPDHVFDRLDEEIFGSRTRTAA